MKSSKPVAIVGAAESDLGKVPGMTSLDLQAQAAARALRDAGLALKDVDGVFAHVDDKFAGLQLAEYLGIRPRYVDSTSVGGMSNVMHVRHAMAAIQAGMCEVALVAYGSTQLSDGSRKVGGAPEDMRMPRGQFITPMASSVPSAITRWWRSCTCSATAPPIATWRKWRWRRADGRSSIPMPTGARTRRSTR